jgi:Xaa-Pro dipeptidase
MVSRRSFLASAAIGAAGSIGTGPARTKELASLTKEAQAITGAEHAERLARLQSMLQKNKVGATLIEAGSTLEYFTGIRWWRSERTTAAIVPARGATVVVTPSFEEPSVRETLKVAAEVRTWREDASPFERLASALRERAGTDRALAVEPTTRYFIVEGVTHAGGGRSIVNAEPYIRACRSRKSPAELALMQLANDVTLAALRQVHGSIQAGMRSEDIINMVTTATTQLGGSPEFTLVLLNEASAFPHGSASPQSVREGSVILIDTGCTVHGYQSDISRSWVYGTPSAKVREVWSTVKRGQEIALETAKIGTPVGDLDRAVRAYYEGRGWSKDYTLPGLSHRTGHGIGLDGHESPYLVRNDRTPLEAGMCFSDEPGLYIPGEFGIRLEDCWTMTDAGPKLFTPLARSIEDPI